MTHATEEQLVLLYYGEAAAREEVETHLAQCAQCRGEYNELQLLLNLMESVAVPEPGAGYGTAVWRCVRHAAPVRRVRTAWWRKPAAATALAALLIAAYIAGRLTPSYQPPAAHQNDILQRVLLIALSEHLERSEMVLVELLNAPDASVDMSDQQAVAQDLVADNRLLHAAAKNAGDAEVAALLEELERVLLEIAHAPPELGEFRLEIRGRIEEQGTLFKLRVLDSSRQEERL